MSSLTLAAKIASLSAAETAVALGLSEITEDALCVALLQPERLTDLVARSRSGIPESELRQFQKEVEAFHMSMSSLGAGLVLARRRLRALAVRSAPLGDFTGHRSRVCRLVYARASDLGSGPIGVRTLLHSVLLEPSANLRQVLRELGVDDTRLREDLAAPRLAPEAAQAGEEPVRMLGLGRDLTELARARELEEVIGRDDEMRQVVRILLQATKNSALLLGDPGVGKTAIVEGLAQKAAAADAAGSIRNLRFVEVSPAALFAGAKLRGDLEERLERLLKHAEREPNLVIFIDEIHSLLGQASGDAPSVASILKPALARGRLRLVGATTPGEYQRYIEPDEALVRRLQPVMIDEPEPPRALAILKGIANRLTRHHGVRIDDEVFPFALELAGKFRPDRRLPDSAIELLDQACARVVFSTFSSGRTAGGGVERVVSRDDVKEVVAEACDIPSEYVDGFTTRRKDELERQLSERVLGQPAVIGRVVARLVREPEPSRRGPLAAFLFVGPSGTGKSELTRALARAAFGDSERILHFDLSTFQEEHSVARLLGAPPGFVGHDRGGELTNALRARPVTVLSFDHIDRAHPRVLDLVCSLLEQGRLTDAKGKAVSLREAIVVLSVTLSDERSGRRVGFGVGSAAEVGASPAPTGALSARLGEAMLARLPEPLYFSALSGASRLG